MADVFELELQDILEDDPNHSPDSDDDIIEVDQVIKILNYLSFNDCYVFFWIYKGNRNFDNEMFIYFRYTILNRIGPLMELSKSDHKTEA